MAVLVADKQPVGADGAEGYGTDGLLQVFTHSLLYNRRTRLLQLPSLPPGGLHCGGVAASLSLSATFIPLAPPTAGGAGRRMGVCGPDAHAPSSRCPWVVSYLARTISTRTLNTNALSQLCHSQSLRWNTTCKFLI